MANPGHLSDRSAHSYRKGLGESIGSVSFMVNLVSKHGSEDGMAQMIVAFIACNIGKQMLDGVIDMFLSGNLLIVPVKKCFAILFGTIFGNLGSSEHSMRREEVKGIGCCGLSAAVFIGYGRYIRLYAGNDSHHSSSFARSLSKHNALQDSM